MDNLQASDNSSGLAVLFWTIVLLLALWLVVALVGSLALTWLRAYLFGIPISIAQILAMRWRGAPPGLIVASVITLMQRGYRFNPLMFTQAQTLYLTRRGEIDSPSQLADLTGEYLKSDGPG